MTVFSSLLAVVAFACCSVRAWDLGVVTSSEIQFLLRREGVAGAQNRTREVDHVVENTAAGQLNNMMAAAYDPVGKYVYVSDYNAKAGSIFRVKTTGDTAYAAIEPIVAKQSAMVQGMAFDERTSTLYWTLGTNRTIKYLKVPENGTKTPLTGQVLLTFEQEVPQGIAIDSCRGYLYWTNKNHSCPTVERSRLDGTERRVIAGVDLFQPLAVAVDVERNLVYWSDEHDLYYKIESYNADSGSRTTVNKGMHLQPFSMAVDDRSVYWSDWTDNAVWSCSKTESAAATTLVAKFESVSTPSGLFVRSGNAIETETVCNAATNRTQVVAEAGAEPPVSLSYEALRNICKNNGVLHATNGTCECAPGYAGSNCETSACDGYCVTGTCALDERTGRPRCRCPEYQAVHGDRCEKQLCPEWCQNGGECLLDEEARNPRCKCPDGYSGDACEMKLSLIDDLCHVYCEHTEPESRRSSFCMCQSVDNALFESMNSDKPQCNQLNRTVIGVFFVLTLLILCLGSVTMVLARKVRFLGRRPRIKKRIVVNKSITPLTSCRPPQQQNQQCEITIENCCNMNICETPCFEQDFRPQKLAGMLPSMGKSKKEDKANLLSNTDVTSSEDEKPPY